MPSTLSGHGHLLIYTYPFHSVFGNRHPRPKCNAPRSHNSPSLERACVREGSGQVPKVPMGSRWVTRVPEHGRRTVPSWNPAGTLRVPCSGVGVRRPWWSGWCRRGGGYGGYRLYRGSPLAKRRRRWGWVGHRIPPCGDPPSLREGVGGQLIHKQGMTVTISESPWHPGVHTLISVYTA